MKKTYVRIFSAVLIALLSLFALVSCAGTDPDIPTVTLVVPEGDLYIEAEYKLSYTLSNGEEMYGAEYKVLPDGNTASATIDGYKIRAAKPGTATVVVTGHYYGEDISATATLTFKDRTIALDIEDKSYRIGDSIELKYKFLPDRGSYEHNNSYITYEIVSGDAVIKTENNRDYLIAREAGTVTLKLLYTDSQGRTLEATDTVTFIRHSFDISIDKAMLFVGYELPITATAKDINGFDQSKVTYVLESGAATLTGNTLCATAEGEVKVYATYDFNGAILKSNTLELTFGFDENVILTAEDLSKMNNNSAVMNLLADIDLSATSNWTPITGFTGILRGNGHTISGLKMTVGNLKENCGLIDVVTGKVTDLTLSGNIISTGESKNVGLLCGTNEGTIENVKVEGSINAPYCSYVGGVAGLSNGSGLVNCEANVTVTAKSQVGGVAGQMNATRSADVEVVKNVNRGEIKGAEDVGGVFGCVTVLGEKNNDPITVGSLENYGKVTASGNNAGGVIGRAFGNYYDAGWSGNYYSYLSILGCVNQGAVNGADCVGGIVGKATDKITEISMCTSTGSVKGSTYVGGYVGDGNRVLMRSMKNVSTVSGKAYVGGVAGRAGKMDLCENEGAITVTNFIIEDDRAVSYVGGVAGYAATVTNCKNSVDLNVSLGGSFVGGVVGYMAANREAALSVSNNQNTGAISGVDCVGGVAGMLTVAEYQNNDAITVSDNKNTGEITGSKNCIGGIFGRIEGNKYRYSYSDYYSYLSISGCSNEGEVNGVDYVGGIAGLSKTYVTEISLCTTTGAVTGNMYVGGFVGDASGVTLRNLKNSNVITGKAYIGGVAGIAGQLMSCENSGSLTVIGHHIDNENTPLSYVGGVAGYATGAVDCKNTTDVTVSDGGRYVAGVVGYILATNDPTKTISGNKNEGDVTGTDYVGGVAGYVAVKEYQSNNVITVENNKNEGDISASGNYVGGIIGWSQGCYYRYNYSDYYTYVKFTGCSNSGEINGTDCVGGILGKGGSYVSEMSLCTATGDVTGNKYVGAYAGDAGTAKLIQLRNNNTVTGKAYVGGVAGKAGVLQGCENNGRLAVVGYELDESNNPLSYVGGVAGYATGAINCANNEEISAGGWYVGGIAGYISMPRVADESVKSNKNTAAVNGTTYVGGIAGAIEVQNGNNAVTLYVDDNTNEGDVSASGSYVGGIAGKVSGGGATLKVTNSKSRADVSGYNYVGGVIGSAERGVDSNANVWNTNRFEGSLSASGVNRGDQYGAISN